MFIHNPDPKLSTAENLLRLLRPDQKFSQVEAKVLDTALILHMEHGGGNNLTDMMANIRENVKDYSDKEEISAYLSKIIDKEAFDRKGLIYGMGHAVYSLSDPRERVFRKYVEELAAEKGREEDLLLYENVEELVCTDKIIRPAYLSVMEEK